MNFVNSQQRYLIFKQFYKCINPQEEINGFMNGHFIYQNEMYNIYIKKENQNKIKLKNKFEERIINCYDYNIITLIDDFQRYINYPLEYILLSNESLNYFMKKNTNYIKEIGLYDEFKEYFSNFIKSKFVISALKKSEKHNLLLQIIQNNPLILDKIIIILILLNLLQYIISQLKNILIKTYLYQ